MRTFLKFSLVMLCMASMALAQSNVQYCNLACNHKNQVHAAPEYNRWWAGAKLSQALLGNSSDFDLNLGLTGKVILNYVKIGKANVILYGNLAPSTLLRDGTVVDAVNSSESGLGIGISPYFILGDLGLNSLTVVTEAESKMNDFGDKNLWTYRFSGGLDGSIAAESVGSGFNISGKASYIVVSNQETFKSLQTEVPGNYWLFTGNVIVPLADKLGLLFQGQATREARPLWRVGLILSTALGG